jgi:hypothetical protein
VSTGASGVGWCGGADSRRQIGSEPLIMPNAYPGWSRAIWPGSTVDSPLTSRSRQKARPLRHKRILRHGNPDRDHRQRSWPADHARYRAHRHRDHARNRHASARLYQRFRRRGDVRVGLHLTVTTIGSPPAATTLRRERSKLRSARSFNEHSVL